MKLNAFFSFLVMVIATASYAESLPLYIQARQKQKMKMLVVLVEPTEQVRHIALEVSNDLSCNAMRKLGFNVTRREVSQMPDKATYHTWYKEGYSLATVLLLTPQHIELFLIDTQQGIVKASQKIERASSLAGTAHKVADAVWPILTGQEGIFSTMIVYCKERHEANHYFRDLYVQTPFTCQDRKRVLEGGKPLLPRWHSNPDVPLILYSETTPSNIRLMSLAMHGQRKVISNFEGMNMAPSFSRDGSKVVYCFTHNNSSQLVMYRYDHRSKKPVLHTISPNAGNNTSPCLRDNGDVIFCSDYETRVPQLYYYTAKTGKTQRLTTGGYCAAPSFCEKNQSIVYCKMVEGVTQLFVYNLQSKEHRQITFDAGSKDECSWSPCGNYIVYCHNARIALRNVAVQESTFLTPVHERCSYPCWSARYTHYVEIGA